MTEIPSEGRNSSSSRSRATESSPPETATPTRSPAEIIPWRRIVSSSCWRSFFSIGRPALQRAPLSPMVAERWSRLLKRGDGRVNRLRSLGAGCPGPSGVVSHLLLEQVAAIGDSPVEGNRGKIRTVLALALGPASEAGCNWAKRSPEQVQQVVIGSDGLDSHAFVISLGAKMNELDQPVEFVARHGLTFDTGHLAYLFGKLDLAIRGNQRTAVRNAELQQRGECDHKDENGAHRGLATSWAVASRASSGMRVKV